METSRHRGRTRDSEVPTRDKEILSAAFALFNSVGYHAVSLAAIASEAKVAVRTIYLRFGGKVGLVESLIANEAGRHATQLAALNLPDAAEERLQTLAEHLRVRASDEAFRKLQVIVISSREDALSRACYSAGPGQFLALLREELERAQACGYLSRECAVEELVDLFFAIVVGPQPARHVESLGKIDGRIKHAHTDQRVRLFIRIVASAQMSNWPGRTESAGPSTTSTRGD